MWDLQKVENFEKFQNWFQTNNDDDDSRKEQIYEKFNINQQKVDEFILEIIEWCRKQPEIPVEGQDREFVAIMLQRNKYQLERTKQKIVYYFQTIPKFGEFFANLGHNRLSKELCFSLPLPKLTEDLERIVIFKLNNKNGRNFDLKQAILTILTIATLNFHYDKTLRLRFILDFDNFEFLQFTKIRPSTVFMLLEILERILSISIAGIEIINSPLYLNLVLALLKMTLKPKLLKRVTVHKNLDSLHKTIPQHYLPLGYGSDSVIIEDLCKEIDEIIDNSQEFFEKIASFVKIK